METKAEYKTTSQHGGKRAGAGRKPGTSKRIRTFRLTDETVNRLKEIGDGDATRGIEILTNQKPQAKHQAQRNK